jgi:hypothetical protein
MGASIDNFWARGFPLALIQDEHTQGKIAFNTDLLFPTNNKEIGINVIPDIDAIDRVSKPLPMIFAVMGQFNYTDRSYCGGCCSIF